MNKKIVHSVFEHIVATFPSCNAVEESGGASISYRHLNRHANIIGSLLAERGIGRDKLAGVLLPAGIAYFAAVLGVMKAGSLFMPLELGAVDVKGTVKWNRIMISTQGLEGNLKLPIHCK